jgi:hypothetical protein
VPAEARSIESSGKHGAMLARDWKKVVAVFMIAPEPSAHFARI